MCGTCWFESGHWKPQCPRSRDPGIYLPIEFEIEVLGSIDDWNLIKWHGSVTIPEDETNDMNNEVKGNERDANSTGMEMLLRMT